MWHKSKRPTHFFFWGLFFFARKQQFRCRTANEEISHFYDRESLFWPRYGGDEVRGGWYLHGRMRFKVVLRRKNGRSFSPNRPNPRRKTECARQTDISNLIHGRQQTGGKKTIKRDVGKRESYECQRMKDELLMDWSCHGLLNGKRSRRRGGGAHESR